MNNKSYYRYTKKIQNLADSKRRSISDTKWNQLNIKLEEWKNEKHKHDVDHYYSDPDFGLCYVKNLYLSRVQCFYELLKDVRYKENISNVLLESRKIYSFCCGPGPEIAAFICFIRNELQRPSQQLDFVAVDKLNYWRDYVDEINSLDYYCNITFRNASINRNFIDNLAYDNDVCIMSYPQAVVFENIWPSLKEKFKFILVVDQNKWQLINLVKRYDFTVCEFQSLGTKTYFYYVKPKIYINYINTNHTGRYSYAYALSPTSNTTYRAQSGYTATAAERNIIQNGGNLITPAKIAIIVVAFILILYICFKE